MRLVTALAAALLALAPLSGASQPERHLDAVKAEYRRPTEKAPEPEDNPSTAAKVRLGWALFQDRRLSSDHALACVDCHQPELDWQDGRPRALGFGGHALHRRTMPLFDAAWGETFFWDGRAASLEAQAVVPIEAPDEMNQKMDEVVARLRAVPFYQGLFAEAFPEAPEITGEKAIKAIAAFERTIVSGETAFDRWIDGDETAIGEAAKRGFALFNGKANCAQCHGGWRFTDDGFHDTGLPGDDPGRGPIIDVPLLEHSFKTPSLRNVARRPPYMHDGSLATLREVVDHYADGILDRPTLSDDLKRISLTEAERADLVVFLETLSDAGPPDPRWSPFH